MDSTVKPVYGQPIFYQQGVQLMKIAVGNVESNARNIYVASGRWGCLGLFSSALFLIQNLALSHTTNFRLSKLKEFADDKF